MLYKVNFKLYADIFKNQERKLIIEVPIFVEQSKDIFEKKELIQTIIENQIQQRIKLYKFEPLTLKNSL